jgi:hypothetical protein
MSLNEMMTALEIEVNAPRNRKLFEEAKRHQPELRDYEDVFSAFAVLGNETPADYGDKEPLTRAILREAQRRPLPYWNAVLVVAFYPMLVKLRRSITGGALPADDLDQLILTVFLEVAGQFPLQFRRDRTCMYLRQMTRREVFARIRHEQRLREKLSFQSPENMRRLKAELELYGLVSNWPEIKPSADRQVNLDDDADLVNLDDDADLVLFLLDHAGDLLDGDKFELVVTTLVRREMISSYVDRIHPGLTKPERSRVYQRIKRRHSRALVLLREAFADFYREAVVSEEANPGWAPTESSDWWAAAA